MKAQTCGRIRKGRNKFVMIETGDPKERDDLHLMEGKWRNWSFWVIKWGCC